MQEVIERRSFLIWPAMALAARAADQLRDTQRLTFTGIGPIRIGMTEAQLRGALKQKLELEEFDEGCSYLTPAVKGIAFMLLDSRVARVDINEGTWLTKEGAGIGFSEARIRRLYPQVRVEPHPYLDDGQGYYLRVTPGDPKIKDYELLFETERTAVTSFRAGLARAVNLIEGCA